MQQRCAACSPTNQPANQFSTHHVEVAAPQLRRDEQLVASDLACLDGVGNGLSNRAFVSVALGITETMRESIRATSRESLGGWSSTQTTPEMLQSHPDSHEQCQYACSRCSVRPLRRPSPQRPGSSRYCGTRSVMRCATSQDWLSRRRRVSICLSPIKQKWMCYPVGDDDTPNDWLFSWNGLQQIFACGCSPEAKQRHLIARIQRHSGSWQRSGCCCCHGCGENGTVESVSTKCCVLICRRCSTSHLPLTPKLIHPPAHFH